MSNEIPTGFVNYLRSYPGVILSHALSEKARLQAAPETAQWFASKGINDPTEQQSRISYQARKNAEQYARADLQEAREKYGVKTLTPDALRAAVARDAADYEPSAKVDKVSPVGTDQATIYREKVMPELVNNEMARLSAYTPFDQPPQAVATPNAQQAVASTQSPVAPQRRMASSVQSDPVLSGIMNYMSGAQKQGAQQEAGQQVTAPVVPMPAQAPVVQNETPGGQPNGG